MSKVIPAATVINMKHLVKCEHSLESCGLAILEYLSKIRDERVDAMHLWEAVELACLCNVSKEFSVNSALAWPQEDNRRCAVASEVAR